MARSSRPATRCAQAQTTNGSVFASLERTDGRGTSSFRTVNGDIIVALPESPDVEIDISTTNGEFSTDLFPVRDNRYGIPGWRVRGRLGAGGRQLKIRSVNGDVELRRRSR